jgi:hypothetical protein
LLFTGTHKSLTGSKSKPLPAAGFSERPRRKSPFAPGSDHDFLWPTATILEDIHADHGRTRGQKMYPQGRWRSLFFKPRRPEKHGPTSVFFRRQLQAS